MPRFYFNEAKRTTACVLGRGPLRMEGKVKAAEGDEYDPMVGAILAHYRMAHPEEYSVVRDLAREAADAHIAKVAKTISEREAELRVPAEAVEVDPAVGKRLFDAIFGVGTQVPATDPASDPGSAEPEPAAKPAKKKPGRKPKKS